MRRLCKHSPGQDTYENEIGDHRMTTIVRISAPLVYGAHVYQPGSFVEVDSALASHLVSQGKAEMGAETLAVLANQPMNLWETGIVDPAARLEAELTQLDHVLRESAEERAPERQEGTDEREARAAAGKAQAQQDAEAQVQRGWAHLKNHGLFGG
jgi:hypothetical protein